MKFIKKHEGFMSYGVALIILMFCMSFGLYLVNPCNSNLFTYLVFGDSNNCVALPAGATGQTGVVAGVVAQLTSIFTNLGVLSGGIIVAFATGFPNGYAIFAAAAYFLLGAFNMPINLFNASSGLPNEVRLFFIAIFSLLNVFTILAYAGAKNV